MRGKVLALLLIFSLFVGVSTALTAEDVSSTTKEKYQKTKGEIESLLTTKAGVYAKDTIDAAYKSIVRAQEAIGAKNEKAAMEALDLAGAQMDLAKAQSEEREATEKVTVTRGRVDWLQQQLSDILSGKGDAK